MKRFVVVLTAALMVTLGLMVPTSRPAHAAGAACYFSDTVGQVYPDWYQYNKWNVYDSWNGQFKNIDTDIRAYRLSESDGHCYRGYYTSVWDESGGGGNFHPQMRVWVCGTYKGTFDGGTAWGNRRQVVSNYQFTSIAIYTFTNINGQSTGLYFGDYGSGSNCLPQGDNVNSSACSNTWSACPSALFPNGNQTQWYTYLH
jgi:hypothetical protein